MISRYARPEHQEARVLRRVYRLTLPYYSRDLFMAKQESRLRWFRYQQRLIIGRLIRSVAAALFPLPAAGPNPFLAQAGIDRLAWERAVRQGYDLGHIITPAQLSRRMAWAMMFWNVATWLVHPFYFVANLRRPRLFHAHERLFYGPRLRAVVRGLRHARVKSIGVTNDHVGECFQTATAAALLGIPVTYIQHGAVTDRFPRNHFSTLVVWDQATADIYSRKTEGRIIVDPHLISAWGPSLEPQCFTLVALTTIYPFWRVIRSLRTIVSLRRPEPVLIRFHPSDRRMFLVMLACRVLNIPVLADTPMRPFSQSYEAATLGLIASSSVLNEAARLDPEKLIWVRHMGELTDYYNLAARLPCIVNSREELDRALRRSRPKPIARPNGILRASQTGA